MSNDVGWDLEKYEATKVEIVSVGCNDLAGTLNRIARLKLNQNLSTIRLVLPGCDCPFELRHEKVIDGISDLLKANTNIKILKVDVLL